MPVRIWRPRGRVDGECRIRLIEGTDDPFLINYGEPLGQRWSDDAHCDMDPNFPKDIALSDCLAGATVLVVSSSVRSVLEQANIVNVEFLPLAIINHKGRVASRDYWAVNPLVFVDCIDQPASGLVWNKIDKSRISGCTSLVLTMQAIPDDVSLFRPLHWPKLVLIKRGLIDRLHAAGLSGFTFVDPLDYDGTG